MTAKKRSPAKPKRTRKAKVPVTAKLREQKAASERRRTADKAEIAPMPRIKNRKRRDACRLDLRRFLVEYFPATTGLSPFSDDHIRVIGRIQDCILRGGRFCNIIYRGFAKTTIAEGAALWATLYGHRQMVPIFGADATAAAGIIESLKSELSENDLLAGDFPEVCHAIRALEDKPQRCKSQTYNGEPTHVQWTANRIVLPTIPKSAASGAVLCARGITGGFRGLKFKRADGTQQRPDFVILDDPQTDEMARSPVQVTKILGTLRKAILKLGSHQRRLAVVVNGTVIEEGDAIDQLGDANKNPSWDGVRIPMVKAWATAHETLWLGKYAELRNRFSKDIAGDQQRAHAEATDFYRQHRAEMDAGAVVSWEHCYDHETEISAIQHAYNAFIDDGAEAFASEYQVSPLPRITTQLVELTADQIAGRFNRHAQGVAPAHTTRLSAFVDLGAELLFYVACGWSEDFSGAVLDYGTWPRQTRAYFAAKEARPSLSTFYPGLGLEAQIHAGLSALTEELLSTDWLIDGGGSQRIGLVLVDSGWQDAVVEKFCRTSPYRSSLQPSKGRGITASNSSIGEWAKKPGERHGLNWVLGALRPGHGTRLLTYDANAWKSFLTARLAAPIGGKGCLTLFGDRPDMHQLFAEHCTSEYRVRTAGRGRIVDEWKLRAGRDNHWLDCLVGASVAASVLGVSLAETAPSAKPKAPVSFREMYDQARAADGKRPAEAKAAEPQRQPASAAQQPGTPPNRGTVSFREMYKQARGGNMPDQNDFR